MILVTGATGNVGSELVPQLIARGATVRAMVHAPERVESVAATGAEPVVGELGDAASLDPVLDGVERVFLVTPTALKQPEWERNVTERARAAGVERVVRLSVANADPDSEVLIYRNHGLAELGLRQSGLSWTVLRATDFMQNFLLSAASIAGEGTVYGTGVGPAKVAMVDVRDIAAVAVEALTGSSHEGSTYLVTGGEALSFEEAARQLSAGLGREVAYVELSPDEYRAALVDDGVPDWYADALAQLYVSYGRGIAEATTTTVRELTGAEPRRVEQFARDHAEALLSA